MPRCHAHLAAGRIVSNAQVSAVSCGPYHTAAIVEGGLLYTWGNGLFGKLGHGSHESEYRPRRRVSLLQLRPVMLAWVCCSCRVVPGCCLFGWRAEAA